MTDHCPVLAAQLFVKKHGKNYSSNGGLVFGQQGDGPCGGHETEIAWVALGGFIGHYVEDIASKNLADFWVSS